MGRLFPRWLRNIRIWNTGRKFRLLLMVTVFVTMTLKLGMDGRLFFSPHEVVQCAECNSKSENHMMQGAEHHSLPLCPPVPPNLVGPLNVTYEVLRFEDIAELNPDVQNGRYKPTECISRNRVAILIPYRQRETHLKILLHNLLPFLKRQQIDFGIFVIELENDCKFNRGMLMNIGFTEVARMYDYQCFVFHDVDLIPENDRTLYICPNQPLHMSVLINKNDYKIQFQNYFGGVTILNKEHFLKINGFSNKYFGWGCEDDDLRYRILNAGLKLTRYNDTIARYQMIPHPPDDRNPLSVFLRLFGNYRYASDGLNSLKYYTVHDIEITPLYTRIPVTINEDQVAKHNTLAMMQEI